jgi:hypothetical protein
MRRGHKKIRQNKKSSFREQYSRTESAVLEVNRKIYNLIWCAFLIVQKITNIWPMMSENENTVFNQTTNLLNRQDPRPEPSICHNPSVLIVYNLESFIKPKILCGFRHWPADL